MFSKGYLIKNEDELDLLIQACIESHYASVDFETNGEPLYNKNFKPTILSVTFKPGFGVSLPLLHHEVKNPKPSERVRWLKKFGEKVISNPKVTKIAWNWKFDNQVFHLYRIFHRGTVIDGMLAKYLLNEERPNGLKDMVRLYLPDSGDYEKSEGFDKLPWDKKPLDQLVTYGCQDTDYTFRLGVFFESKLIELGLYPLYRNLLMCASRVLQEAEEHGLPLDADLNAKLIDKYSGLIKEYNEELRNNKVVKRYQKKVLREKVDNYIKKLQEDIEFLSSENQDGKKNRQIKSREDKISRILAGEFVTKDEQKLIEPVNFSSVKQLIDLLYNHPDGFGLPIIAYTIDSKTKKETENPSTSEDTLLKLQRFDKSGFIESLLKLRGVQTINSTFIVGFRELLQDDGRLHPKFLIHGTTSGRLSSQNPNGQNIPKTIVNPDVKLQFIPPPGKLFLAYDYSQAELRIMAHLANETTMLEWFREGKDIHLASACKKYHFDYEEALAIYSDELHPEYKLWKKRRKEAKTINFGIVYEQSAGKLAETLSTEDHQVTKEEGQEFLDAYFSDFPKVKKFMEKQHKFMEKHGYCVSLFGRKRRCPDVYSDNYSKYLEALRQSTNMPCQSAASDMALFASVLVHEKVKTGQLPPMVEVDTVHDSVYQFIEPKYITADLIYQLWDICRNPSTKKYFGFSIDDVDMSMDFTIGRTMAEEFPFIPGYDYNKLFDPDFNKDDYYAEYKKFRDVAIKDYPVKFKEMFDRPWRKIK